MNTPDNVITVDGEEVEVREDTAKAFRFVQWGVVTGAIALAILALAFITLYWWAAGGTPLAGSDPLAQASSK